MRIVFLGDSHLARVRRDVSIVGPHVCNAAEGGATALDLVPQAAGARRWIYLAPPGVDESRLTGSHTRTNAVLDEYRDVAVSVCHDAGARVVRTERVVGPLGSDAFVSDGLHLSERAYKTVLAAIAEAAQATA